MRAECFYPAVFIESLTSENQYGEIPLHLAAARGDIEMVRIILSARPSLGVLQDVHRNRIGLQKPANTDITNLIQRAIGTRLLASGPFAAKAPNVPPSPLQRFVQNNLHEPRLMGIVNQFL
jgi:hypothetical protein